MNDAVARTLLAIAAFLFVALLLGVFAGPARGLVLCSVALMCLAACRIKLPRGDPEIDLADSGAAEPRTGYWQRLLAGLGWNTAQGRPSAGARPAPGALIGVLVLDDEYRVLWCNASAAAHFAIRPRAATGLPAARVVFSQEFDAYLAAGNFSRPLTLKGRGGDTTLSISLVPHLHSQWLLLSRDVTQETRAEVLRREGVADALHELCTPVTVLAGHLDTLRRLKLEPWRSSDYLEYMEHQCRRMQSTIGDLVRLWTLESAPPPSREERVDVGVLLAGIREDMAALSGGKHHIALDAQPGLGLFGCVAEIASAFRNLAVNAVRYTPPGGAIWIVWRRTETGAELVVEDNGIGIAPEHIPHLTERFYQVDRERSRASGGSGLGLSIVKNILERHQATLKIESAPGQGSVFCAKFPVGRVLTMGGPALAEDVALADAAAEPALPSGMVVPAIAGKIPAQAS